MKRFSVCNKNFTWIADVVADTEANAIETAREHFSANLNSGYMARELTEESHHSHSRWMPTLYQRMDADMLELIDAAKSCTSHIIEETFGTRYDAAYRLVDAGVFECIANGVFILKSKN